MSKEKQVEKRSRQANDQRRHRAEGKCAFCDTMSRSYRCPKCQEKKREPQRLLMAARRAAGLA